MGASTFIVSTIGTSVKEAFASARQNALHENGHGGYTGSIAEKSEFVLVSDDIFSSVKEAVNFAESLIDGAVKYLFFGWASS